MENYLEFIGFPIILIFIAFFIAGAVDEAWRKLGNIGKWVLSGPFLLGFIGFAVWTIVEPEARAVFPLYIGMAWLIIASLAINRFVTKEVVGRSLF